jgi:hypothetical protein
MLLKASTLLLGVVAASLIAGCGSGTVSNSVSPTSTTSGGAGTMPTTPVPITAGFTGGSTVTGSKDALVATASVDSLSVTVGASQTVSITFASSDGRLMTGFGVPNSLGTLPAGWSGPGTFACAAVSTGSNCVLTLTYAPTAAGNGTLTIDYEYIDNAAQAKTGNSLTLSYLATTNDNVVAAATPVGQVNAAVSGNQAVAVNFTTDDGNAATNLTVTTNLGALPSGWSTQAASLACAIVSTGNGCELALTYAPTAAGSGVLTLNYAYQDDSGAAKSGALNIPYFAAKANTVIATPSPASQITAVQKTGGQPVAITFTTNDGAPAGALFVTSDLTKLPAGWTSSSSSFSCGAVSTGNGCQLHLNYAPTALTLGTLTLTYAYTDGAGNAQTGVATVAYAGTTNDNVVGTASPTGQINAVVSDGTQTGNGTQAVTVTFTTDDARPATALQLTSSLTALPAGWSSPVNSFSCTALDADTVCKLPLSYAPSIAGNGTLMLTYTYENNANEAKTGTVSIPYRATTNDNVVGTPSVSSLPTLRTGASASATVTFTTDDGNPASLLAITSGLNPLPAGWSASSGAFKCATVSAGTACTLTLAYAPTIATTASMLTLGYSYLNDAGYPSTGSVSIAYSAFTPYLYVADDTAISVSACPLSISDAVQTCITASNTFNAPSGIALYANFAYVTNAQGNTVAACSLGAGGALSNCASVGTFAAPTAVATNPTAPFIYLQQSSGLTVCAITPATGTLSACTITAAAFAPLNGIALSADGAHAYSVQSIVNTVIPADSTDFIEVCNVSATDGTLGACAPSVANTPLAVATLAVHNNDLYLSTSTGALYVCPIGAAGVIVACETTATGSNATAISFEDNTAFLSTGSTTLQSCLVNADGTLGSCTAVSDPTFTGTAGMVVR